MLDSNGAGNAYTNPCYGGGDTYQNLATSATEFDRLTLKDQQTGRCLDSNASEKLCTSPCNWDNFYENWDPRS